MSENAPKREKDKRKRKSAAPQLIAEIVLDVLDQIRRRMARQKAVT